MGLLIALSVLIGVFFLNFNDTPQIILKDAKGKTLAEIPLGEADYFEVEFRHSVNKGLVRERYHIDSADNTISLETGWFESYGAGMMDTISEDMVMTEEDDMLRIDFPEQKLPYITYRSAGIANHKMTYQDNEIYFFEKWPYQSIQISIDKKNT